MCLKNSGLFFFIALSVLSVSCTSIMRVKVAVIDRHNLMTSPEVLFLEVQAISEAQAVKINNGAYQEQSKYYIKTVKEIIEESVRDGRMSSSDTMDFLKAVIEEIEDTYFNKIVPTVLDGISKFQSVILKSNNGEDITWQTDILYSAKMRFIEADNLLNNLLFKLNKDNLFSLLDNVSAERRIAVKNNITNSINTLKSSLSHNELYENGLFNDPLNSLVTKSSDKYWKKKYNKTLTKNFLGNSDVAVVMQTPGNFFIKGVRMDAENVTNAFAKTFNQSVQLLTKIYGIPANTAKTPTETNDLDAAAALQKITAQSDKLQQIRIQQSLTTLSAISMMDVILARKDLLENDEDYKEQVKQIQDIYKVYKKQITTSKN